MKQRFTEEQIAYALKRQEAGTTVAEICRELNARGEWLEADDTHWGGTCDSPHRFSHLPRNAVPLCQSGVPLRIPQIISQRVRIGTA
jgi:hypothetical protein